MDELEFVSPAQQDDEYKEKTMVTAGFAATSGVRFDLDYEAAGEKADMQPE